MLSKKNSGNDSGRAALESASEEIITLKAVTIGPFFRKRSESGSERANVHRSLDLSAQLKMREHLELADTGISRIKDSPRVISAKYKPEMVSEDAGNSEPSVEASSSVKP